MSSPFDTAYDYIKTKILNGIYQPSQKLTEVQLSEEIGVSRNTVIKALLKLEQENLVLIEKNKGATIKSFTLTEVVNYLEIREVLEGLTIRSSVTNISEEELLKLESIAEGMQESLKENNFDKYSSLNKDFHDIIYEASQNQQSVELIKMIKTQLNRFHFRTILVPGRNQESIEEHKRILQALKSRNVEEAEKAIVSHVSNIRKIIETNYHYLL